MITEDYVSFEVAKLLKEKGFAEKCVAYYPQCITPIKLTFGGRVNYNASNKFKMLAPISAPTHQMARRWLMEMHNIFIEVCLCWSENPRECPPQYYALIIDTKTGNSLVKKSDCKDGMNPIADKCAFPKYFEKHEEAVEAALKYCLENLI